MKGNKLSLGVKASMETKKKISEGHKGEKNCAWKGDNVAYETLHYWMIRTWGKATHCQNKSCLYKNPKRFEYALIHGKNYSKNRDCFMMLCPSCHRKYDMGIIEVEVSNG